MSVFLIIVSIKKETLQRIKFVQYNHLLYINECDLAGEWLCHQLASSLVTEYTV